MLTPAQLIARLADLGIVRSSRALTDWREEGLLPPLIQTGLRGGGSTRFWTDAEAVLEQAVAAHCLLSTYARTRHALVTLWLSGYAIDSALAKAVWLEDLQKQRAALDKAASQSDESYLDIGVSAARTLGVPQSLRDFVVSTVESLFDDATRDDDEYRSNIAWLLLGAPQSGQSLTSEQVWALVETVLSEGRSGNGSTRSESESAKVLRQTIRDCLALARAAFQYISDDQPPSDEDAYSVAEASWEKLGYGLFLPQSEAMKFVRSLTHEELDAARDCLGSIGSIIGHCVKLANPAIGKVDAVSTQVTVMGSLGRYLALQLIALGRQQPSWPLRQTIIAIQNFAERVQYADISRENDNYKVSERVVTEWTATREDLSRLWATVIDEKSNPKLTATGGRIDPHSG